MYPILFEVFGVPVRSYGLMLVLGFILAIVLAWRRGPKYGADLDTILDLGVVLLVAGVIGARIGWVVQEWSSYRDDPISVLYIWQGGLTYFGGLAAGVLAGIWYARRRKISFWRWADLCAPSIALGYAITRIGCFLNGCCYGSPTDLPWACTFRTANGLTPPSHPSQLYATVSNLIIVGVLLWWDRKDGKQGQIFWGFLLLHGLYRFLYEFTRAGTTSTYLIQDLLTDAQAVALVVILIGAIGLLWTRRHGVARWAPPEERVPRTRPPKAEPSSQPGS
ncbi:MAG: prolipoprotein diacylglyceryl transferase [Fimbriimonadales bacterium]